MLQAIYPSPSLYCPHYFCTRGYDFIVTLFPCWGMGAAHSQTLALIFTSTHQKEPRAYWLEYSYGRWKAQGWSQWRWEQVRLCQCPGTKMSTETQTWDMTMPGKSMWDMSNNALNMTLCSDLGMHRPCLVVTGPQQSKGWGRAGLRLETKLKSSQEWTLISKPQRPDEQTSGEWQVD